MSRFIFGGVLAQDHYCSKLPLLIVRWRCWLQLLEKVEHVRARRGEGRLHFKVLSCRPNLGWGRAGCSQSSGSGNKPGVRCGGECAALKNKSRQDRSTGVSGTYTAINVACETQRMSPRYFHHDTQRYACSSTSSTDEILAPDHGITTLVFSTIPLFFSTF